MKKKKYLFIIVAVAVILTGILVAVIAGGNQNDPLSIEDAKKVVLKDLSIKESEAGSMHVHPTTVEDTPCYSVYITIDGENWEYIIDAFTGKILEKTETDHGHSH